jgi:hypothetical protein
MKGDSRQRQACDRGLCSALAGEATAIRIPSGRITGLVDVLDRALSNFSAARSRAGKKTKNSARHQRGVRAALSNGSRDAPSEFKRRHGSASGSRPRSSPCHILSWLPGWAAILYQCKHEELASGCCPRVRRLASEAGDPGTLAVLRKRYRLHTSSFVARAGPLFSYSLVKES